jgi:hypothetical protein
MKNYRIQNENGTLLNVATDKASWFNLDDARNLVNYEIGQRIVEHNGVDILWEVM